MRQPMGSAAVCVAGSVGPPEQQQVSHKGFGLRHDACRNLNSPSDDGSSLGVCVIVQSSPEW